MDIKQVVDQMLKPQQRNDFSYIVRDFIVIRDQPNDTTVVLDMGSYSGLQVLQSLEFLFDVVLLGAQSVDDLRITHSNWFMRKVVIIRTDER